MTIEQRCRVNLDKVYVRADIRFVNGFGVVEGRVGDRVRCWDSTRSEMATVVRVKRGRDGWLYRFRLDGTR